jgi:dTDP-4-dehydrorhamnose 3,5-epimerase
MKLTRTDLDGVFIIEPQVFGDSRGWFTETYSMVKFESLGIDTVFIQDNQSYSAEKGILRGLHFQLSPKSQTKLLRCSRGKILDVAVDIRKGSPNYKKWVAVELSSDNFKQIYISKGFAHGFLTLTDNVEVQYKVDEYYSPECDRSIRFDDPEIGVEWGVLNPSISEKDRKAPFLIDSDLNFVY